MAPSKPEATLQTPIQYVKGVGPKRAELLGKLGIRTVQDVLFHFPMRYEDRSASVPINALEPGKTATVTAKVREVRDGRRGRRHVFELVVADPTGFLRLVWYNFRPNFVRRFAPGRRLIVSGKAAWNDYSRKMEMVHPDWEFLDEEDPESLHMGRIVPVYPLTEGLNVKFVRTLIDRLLPLGDSLSDPIPEAIRRRLHLPRISESIRALHFPPEGSDPELLNRFQSVPHKRMIFEELFVLQVGLALKRRRFRKRIEGISFTVGREFRGEMETLLPFELTRAQKKVLEEIYSDLANSQPMNRLLQGDVGSGKTVVALIAALAAIRNGYQAALMAPTEILAEQHFKNIQALLGGRDGAVECVTSANRNKAEIRQRLADGRIQLVVGTHALIQEGIQFKKLGLAVVDEQHRFGVVQRAALIQKGMNCHTLVMTATPIPRTLAMTLYGDLDLSVINELPKGRRPIRTEIYSEREEETVYGLVEREIQKGRQVYFVYPLVEESEKTDLKAATDMTEHLKRDVFPHRTVALLHGRMPSPEKDRVMARFKNGGIDILVATTVIEVGIDVPNATVMVVEHAERFGLSQLHQLRGRVGRGSEESHCLLLVGSPLNDTASARLTALKETADGFRIAEKDLEIRGSGDFFGTKQSGLPELRIANLVRDHKVLEYARKEAFQLVDRDPHLSDAAHDVLREILKSRWKEKFDLGDIA